MLPLKSFLREPLVHFLAIGALIFLAFSVLDDEPETAALQEIVVTRATSDQLAANFEVTWRRAPTDQEKALLVDEFIREEVLVREAKALSLDRNDAVIRNRLRQKMAFLTDSVAGAMQPTEQELADYFEANANQYKPKPTIGFEQVFVGENPSEAEIAEVTAALGAGANPAELGARTLLPPSIPPSQASSIDGAFGKGFFEQLIDIEPDAWRSAIRSGYGVHVVRVTSRTTGDVPGLEEIRETVIRDWRGEKANEIAEAQFQRLRANYVIRLPDPADANSGKSQP